MQTALIFPGQGSQFIGMGKALAARYQPARQTYLEADDILGYSLSTLCFEGPGEQLNHTERAQPALYVAAVAALRVFHEIAGEDFQPLCVAGHSLGQFSALTAAAALSFPDGLRLVQRRADLMRDAGRSQPGGMAAILGLDLAQIDSICAEISRDAHQVVVANDNCPGQTVIAGHSAAVSEAIERLSAAGAKRALPLQVSVAAHSPLMTMAAADFAAVCELTPIHEPLVPVIGNVSAARLDDRAAILADITAQLSARVRWTESVQAMRALGAERFIELGSGSVLTGLLKRIDREAIGLSVDAPEHFEAFVR